MTVWRWASLGAVLVALHAGAAPEVEPVALQVAALEARYGVVLRGEAARDVALVAEVEAGLAALPPGMRRPPGGRLELVLHAEAAPLGMGDGSPERPEWTDEGARFHLYRYAPSEERRATLRLARLTSEEAERLWRRRAVIHAVVRRWDDARGWSRTPHWRRLDGWLAPFEKPLTWKETARITYAGAFSRARGQVSAALDLATFAEELWAPVESLREDALPVDDQVRCQELSKTRALSEFIAEAGLGSLPARGDCPAFDAWADVDALSHFEVLMVAASGRQAESLFGHLLVRPVWREGEVARGPNFERVVQLVALTGMEAKGLGYVVKGMTGGYDTVFLTGTMGDLTHEARELEQRSIRRFRLNLTRAETVRMLERVWELERRGYMGYYFFTDNCATALLFLLNGALDADREVSPPGLLWVLPTATLDTLAKMDVTGSDGRATPLLEYVPDAFESTLDRAVRAQTEQERLLSRLASWVGSGPHARLRALHARLQSSEPEVRRAAYVALPGIVTEALDSVRPESREEARRALHAFVAQSVRVERASVDRAEGERLTIERDRLVAVKKPVEGRASEGARERQRLFEQEDALQRRLAVLDRTTLLREALDSATSRPMTPEELRTWVRAERTEAAFVAATEAQGALNEGPLAEVDPAAFLADDHRRKVEAEQTWAASARRDSGAGRTAVSLGVDFTDEGGARPVLSLRTAGLSEALGDARLHGFQPSSELRVLDGELWVEPRWGVPRLLASQLTLVGYRTLLRELPQWRRSLWDGLGWGAEARVGSDAARALPHRASVQAEALWMVSESRRYADFTALGVGAMAAVHWSQSTWLPAVGPRVSLAHRTGLPGAGANAVRMEAAYAPTWRSGEAQVRHEADATLQLEWWLGRAAGWGVLLTPRAQLRWEGTLHPPARAAPGASVVTDAGLAERRLTLGVEVR
ncbi:DUF4105 domain-containing protein [Myxococcaceae bacterium JPH2]|nr:DUF4105 domain-containing protein [Myxococcaceae bacterium JPH2]